MGKRKRITNELIGEVIIDELAYLENKSSKSARKVLDKSEHLEIEIWCDKHYYTRAQLGDKDGKREGIEEEGVKLLIVKSVPHLIYYSLKVKSFSFVNFEKSSRYTRVVLQDERKEGVLNIVAEFHHLELNKYQVTVITAMTNDDFKISEGQFALFFVEENSTLRKMQQNKMIAIDSFL